MTDITKNKSVDGRHRVAFEMALMMWENTHRRKPNIEDSPEFLQLVKNCTVALSLSGGYA